MALKPCHRGSTPLPTYHALTIYIYIYIFFFSFSSQIHYNIVDSHELKLEEDICIKKNISCLQICSFKCYHYIYKKFLMSKVNKTQLTATMRHKKVTKVLKMGNKILYARYKSNTQELFFGNTQVNNFFFFFFLGI